MSEPTAAQTDETRVSTTTEATMDSERINELREAVAKVKRLDEAVELGWWDDWSVTLAEGVEALLDENERLRGMLDANE